MTRKEFLTELDHRLSSLPRQEADEHLNYYAEMLADRVESGMTDEEAVASMESLDTISSRILNASYVSPVRKTHRKLPIAIGIVAGSALVLSLIVGLLVSLLSYSGSRDSIVVNGRPVDIAHGTFDDADMIGGDFSTAEVVEEISANGIRNIQIEWTSEFIVLEAWDGDTIMLQEAGRTLAMTTNVAGDTLYIKRDIGGQISSDFNDGGFVINNEGINMGSLKIDNTGITLGGLVIDNDGIRWDGTSIDQSGITISDDQSSNLVVSIPRSLAEGGLDSVKINAVSADLELFGINAKELILTTISGNSMVNGSFDGVTVSTTSGEVSFNGTFADGMFNTVSGNLFINADSAIRTFDAQSVSGEVSLSIPADTGFTLEFDSVSGDFFSGDFSVRNSGER